MIPNPVPNLYAKFTRTQKDNDNFQEVVLLRVVGFNPGHGEPLVLSNGSNPRLLNASSFTVEREDSETWTPFTYRFVEGAGTSSDGDVVAYLPGGEAVEVEVDGELVSGVPSAWAVYKDGSIRPLSILKPATTKRTIERDPRGEISGVTEEIA